MADPINTPPAPTPAIVPPATPEPTLLSVPASALFSDEERTLPSPKAATEPAPTPTPAPAPAPEPPKPATEPAPTPTPTPAPAPAPEPTKPEAKIKIGGKEYTQAELEQALKDRAAQPAPAPAAPTPAPEPPKPPTAEEVQKAESDWTKGFVEREKLSFSPTADELETILNGGEDAAKLFGQKLVDAAAKAVLLARKSIYNDLNPLLSQMQNNLTPVVRSQQEVEMIAAEQQFLAAYPDYKEHLSTVREVAQALLTQYPEQCAKMTREQLAAEVERQSSRILQENFAKWNKTGTWKDAGKAPAAAPTPAPAAAPTPVVPAPSANSPAATPAASAPGNWHKSTAKDLQD